VTPERLAVIRLAFDAVIDAPLTAREATLARIGAGDPGLRREVEALLDARARQHPLLDRQAGELLPVAPADAPPSFEGLQLGGYRLGHLVATGGMGAVYEGWRNDDVFAKRVAIKLCHTALVGETTLERFRRERRILARLEHPNIARILDGGTTAGGVPFFVMEFVEGLPLDCHVQQHGLDLRETLRLLRDVCRAVDYAHRVLVVHCDLKPSNVFVTADGIVKLLDFGIAKVLADDDVLPVGRTRTAHGAMSPWYAAPEQFNGGAITTATDVYTLGVLAYELLSGRRPCGDRDGSPWDNAKAILEQQPERPSSVAARTARTAGPEGPAPSRRLGLDDRHLARRLRGDLDRIVLKALEKSAQRRYPLAGALADDLDRYLEGRPVAARPDSVGYRTAKFAGRHRWGIAAAAILVLSLVGGAVATAWQVRRADAARREADREHVRAEQRFMDVRRLVNTLLFDVQNAVGDLPGAASVSQLVSQKALEYLDSLEAEAAHDSDLQAELAAEYDRVGDAALNAGDATLALRTFRRGYDLRRALAEHRADPAVSLGLAAGFTRMGDALFAEGRVAEALASYREAAASSEAVLRSNPVDDDAGRQVIESHARLCERLAETDTASGALASCQRAFTIADSMLRRAPGSRVLAESRTAAAVQLSARLRALGRSVEARTVLADAERLAPRGPAIDWLHDPHLGRWRRRPKSRENLTGLMSDHAAILLQVEAVGQAARFTYLNARQQPVLMFVTALDGKAAPVWSGNGVRVASITARQIDDTRGESWGEGLPYIYERSTLSRDGRTWTSEARMKSASGQEYTDVDIWDRLPPHEAAVVGGTPGHTAPAATARLAGQR
jgi:serine/threonine protein kinase